MSVYAGACVLLHCVEVRGYLRGSFLFCIESGHCTQLARLVHGGLLPVCHLAGPCGALARVEHISLCSSFRGCFALDVIFRICNLSDYHMLAYW